MDPHKVEEILGVPNPKKAQTSLPEETITGQCSAKTNLFYVGSFQFLFVKDFF